MLNINSQFDAGSIDVLACDAPEDIRLALRQDGGGHKQWFYFRLSGARDRECHLHIVNAGEASYPKGFENYYGVATYDRENWFRVPTRFDGSTLSFRHRPERDRVWYAYFAPYSMERHADLIALCLECPHARLDVLAETLDGHTIDLIQIGEPGPRRSVCWIIARQHSGETMAEWWAEGFLHRLCNPAYVIDQALLENAVFYVVPNMNPDGSRRGHHRSNAKGVDLNRAWLAPNPETSPEVYWVRRRMAETGVDFCLDVHGDEAIPYNFIDGPTAIPSLRARQTELLYEYKNWLATLNQDFQTEHGYSHPPPGKANLAICKNYIAETYGCLAMTLEQPFKDTDNKPLPGIGWSPQRARALAMSCVDALHPLIERLR